MSPEIDTSRWHDIHFWMEMKPFLSFDEDLRLSFYEEGVGGGFAMGSLRGTRSEPHIKLFESLANLERLVASFFHDRGIPPVFMFVYPEVWQLFSRLRMFAARFLNVTFEEVSMCEAFWAWDVPLNKSGWKPHRDVGRASLTPVSDEPRSCTIWIPLHSIDENTSAIHVLPKWRDPYYGTARENDPYDWEELLQYVVPLHPKVGGFLVWDHAVLHWGTQARVRPRRSMAVEYVIDKSTRASPVGRMSFNTSLELIAKQILRYQHMHSVEPEVERWCLERTNKIATGQEGT